MTVTKRELLLFQKRFLSVAVFTFIAAFIPAWFFYGMDFALKGSVDPQAWLGIYPLAFILFIPLLTMNSWAGEQKSGMAALFYSSAFKPERTVKGKMVFFLFLTLLITGTSLPGLFFMNLLGEMDWGQILSILLGLSLASLFAFSLGFFMSAAAPGPLSAFVFTAAALAVAWILPEEVSFIGFFSYRARLVSFSQGFPYMKDLFFFFSGISLFYTLSLIRIRRGAELRDVIFPVLLLLLFLLFTFNDNRIDLTFNRYYSLSERSVNLLEEAEERVFIDYYRSEEMRHEGTESIVDVLSRYESHGDVVFNLINEDKEYFLRAAENFQADPVQVKSDTGYKNLYSFIVLRYLDRYRVIPLISGPETLEFEVAIQLQGLIREKQYQAGILIGDDTYEEGSFSGFKSLLSRYFHVSFIRRSEPVPPGMDALFIAGHQSFTSFDLVPLGVFLDQGGAAFFAVEGVFIDREKGFQVREADSPLLEMLEKSGLKIERSLAADEKNTGYEDEKGTLQTYPYWILSQRGESFPELTDPFSGFTLFYASPVAAGEGVPSVNLLTTGERSWTVRDNISVTPGFFRKYYQGEEGYYSLALAAEYDFNPWFVSPGKEHINRIILMGSSLGLTDVSGTMAPENYDFYLRSAFYLAGLEDLMDIRHKYTWDRSFSRIKNKELESAVLKSGMFILTFILPALLLLAGSAAYLRRKKNEN